MPQVASWEILVTAAPRTGPARASRMPTAVRVLCMAVMNDDGRQAGRPSLVGLMTVRVCLYGLFGLGTSLADLSRHGNAVSYLFRSTKGSKLELINPCGLDQRLSVDELLEAWIGRD